ncbi:hypothetical protein [Hymenobacter luteus]|nr:hypothetical protein [Hymenobacter luteus]
MRRLLLTLSPMVFLSVLTGCNVDSSPQAEVNHSVPTVTSETVEVVPTYPISPSSAFSRRLRNVFIRQLTCSSKQIRLGDSIDVQIKEAWLERKWEPQGGGLFSEPDYTHGFALDTLTSTPRTQLVMAIASNSKLGHFDTYSWVLADAEDHYFRRIFSRTDNVLHIALKTSNLDDPHKFYIRACLMPKQLCESVTLDSLTFR